MLTEAESAVLTKLSEIGGLLRRLIEKDTMRAPRLLRLRDAAKYLAVAPAALRRLIQRGEIPVVKLNENGPWLVDVKALDEFIARSQTNL